MAVPVVLAVCFGPFAKQVPLVTPMIFLLSAVLALVNAGVEELFWRGVYVESFSGLWMAYLCPAVGFAIWHFAPLSVIPYKKGALFFVLSSYVLGLCWGLVAFKTKSIGWNTVSHFLVDFSGFGALLYLNR
ncbi:MAG: CPBP family intramembrane metalloprotease [Acidobacteriota bacterium]|nr:CPBP family intramembrane metalloprotease [Acidobacteriota bacterium]